MPKLTYQTRFLMALAKRHCHEVKRSNRYIIVECDEYEFYYLGHHGALRIGRTIRTSRLVSSTFRKELLSEVPAEITAEEALALWDEVHQAAL